METTKGFRRWFLFVIFQDWLSTWIALVLCFANASNDDFTIIPNCVLDKGKVCSRSGTQVCVYRRLVLSDDTRAENFSYKVTVGPWSTDQGPHLSWVENFPLSFLHPRLNSGNYIQTLVTILVMESRASQGGWIGGFLLNVQYICSIFLHGFT